MTGKLMASENSERMSAGTSVSEDHTLLILQSWFLIDQLRTRFRESITSRHGTLKKWEMLQDESSSLLVGVHLDQSTMKETMTNPTTTLKSSTEVTM